MVQVGLTVYFKRRVLYWDNAILPMKESINFLGKYNLSKRKIGEVVV